jgi:hypothetical protein
MKNEEVNRCDKNLRRHFILAFPYPYFFIFHSYFLLSLKGARLFYRASARSRKVDEPS